MALECWGRNMSEQIEFRFNNASEMEVADHLSHCDADFVPSLSSRIKISGYAHKISNMASRFEAWEDGVLIGLVAIYCNDSEHRAAFITSVSVLKGWWDRGIASQLIAHCIGHVIEQGFECIELEVDSENVRAIKLYEKEGFIFNKVSGRSAIMCLNTGKEA